MRQDRLQGHQQQQAKEEEHPRPKEGRHHSPTIVGCWRQGSRDRIPQQGEEAFRRLPNQDHSFPTWRGFQHQQWLEEGLVPGHVR